MAITLPSFVAPNELIQSAWGNGVVNALNELDVEKLNLTGGTISGTLTVNRTGATSLLLKRDNDEPSMEWRNLADTVLASLKATSSDLTLDTFSINPFKILGPTTINRPSGSLALLLQADTETPTLQLSNQAGTMMLQLTGDATTSFIDTNDDLSIRVGGVEALNIDGATRRVRAIATMEIDGALDHDGTTAGFYGTAPIAKQTGVAVTIGAVHAALVALGLIGV